MSRRLIVALIFALIFTCLFTTKFSPVLAQVAQNKAPEAGAHADKTHAEWLAGILNEISAIKPGITRKDFEKTFIVDGGISSLTAERYCYRECPCIKVNVAFKAAAGSKTPSTDPEAKLATISKPYLEAQNMD